MKRRYLLRGGAASGRRLQALQTTSDAAAERPATQRWRKPFFEVSSGPMGSPKISLHGIALPRLDADVCTAGRMRRNILPTCYVLLRRHSCAGMYAGCADP